MADQWDTRGRDLEHDAARQIIDAMVERLKYLEVEPLPPWQDTRSILWQVYCAAREAEKSPDAPIYATLGHRWAEVFAPAPSTLAELARRTPRHDPS